MLQQKFYDYLSSYLDDLIEWYEELGTDEEFLAWAFKAYGYYISADAEYQAECQAYDF